MYKIWTKGGITKKFIFFKKDNFTYPGKLKLLIIGNSFGRDFVNITNETFDMTNVDLIYRDDLSDCIFPYKSSIDSNLYSSANVIIFASGFNKDCVSSDISFAFNNGKNIFYVGTKQFGYNLNWIKRLSKEKRPNQYNPLLDKTVKEELAMSALIPKEYFISLLSPVIKGNQIPITDNAGIMLSTDREHLTKYGAIYFGNHALLDSPYGKLFIKK